MAHIRQSRPDSGLGFRSKVLKIFKVVLSSLGSGWHPACLESLLTGQQSTADYPLPFLGQSLLGPRSGGSEVCFWGIMGKNPLLLKLTEVPLLL